MREKLGYDSSSTMYENNNHCESGVAKNAPTPSLDKTSGPLSSPPKNHTPSLIEKSNVPPHTISLMTHTNSTVHCHQTTTCIVACRLDQRTSVCDILSQNYSTIRSACSHPLSRFVRCCNLCVLFKVQTTINIVA